MKIFRSMLCGIVAALIMWGCAMFVQMEYYPFWQTGNSWEDADETRMLMLLAFGIVTFISYMVVFLGEEEEE